MATWSSCNVMADLRVVGSKPGLDLSRSWAKVHQLYRLHVRPSVRLSVCPSVAFRCYVQMNEDTIVRFSASDRTIILVSGEVKFIRIFAGDHPSEGVKVKRHMSLAKI